MPNNMVLLILLCLCIAVVANLYCQRDGAYIQGKSIALSRSVRAFLGKTNWGGKIPQETVCHHAAGDPNTVSWGKNQWCLLIFFLSLPPPPLSLLMHLSFLYARLKLLWYATTDWNLATLRELPEHQCLMGTHENLSFVFREVVKFSASLVCCHQLLDFPAL